MVKYVSTGIRKQVLKITGKNKFVPVHDMKTRGVDVQLHPFVPLALN
jgi:hypothetical protein